MVRAFPGRHRHPCTPWSSSTNIPQRALFVWRSMISSRVAPFASTPSTRRRPHLQLAQLAFAPLPAGTGIHGGIRVHVFVYFCQLGVSSACMLTICSLLPPYRCPRTLLSPRFVYAPLALVAVVLGDGDAQSNQTRALTCNFFSLVQRKAAEKAEKAPRAAASKSKKEKDPNKPKRALSAYMFFSQDWRERIKAENPDAGFGMF